MFAGTQFVLCDDMAVSGPRGRASSPVSYSRGTSSFSTQSGVAVPLRNSPHSTTFRENAMRLALKSTAAVSRSGPGGGSPQRSSSADAGAAGGALPSSPRSVSKDGDVSADRRRRVLFSESASASQLAATSGSLGNGSPQRQSRVFQPTFASAAGSVSPANGRPADSQNGSDMPRLISGNRPGAGQFDFNHRWKLSHEAHDKQRRDRPARGATSRTASSSAMPWGATVSTLESLTAQLNFAAQLGNGNVDGAQSQEDAALSHTAAMQRSVIGLGGCILGSAADVVAVPGVEGSGQEVRRDSTSSVIVALGTSRSCFATHRFISTARPDLLDRVVFVHEKYIRDCAAAGVMLPLQHYTLFGMHPSMPSPVANESGSRVGLPSADETRSSTASASAGGAVVVRMPPLDRVGASDNDVALFRRSEAGSHGSIGNTVQEKFCRQEGSSHNQSASSQGSHANVAAEFSHQQGFSLSTAISEAAAKERVVFRRSDSSGSSSLLPRDIDNVLGRCPPQAHGASVGVSRAPQRFRGDGGGDEAESLPVGFFDQPIPSCAVRLQPSSRSPPVDVNDSARLQKELETRRGGQSQVADELELTPPSSPRQATRMNLIMSTVSTKIVLMEKGPSDVVTDCDRDAVSPTHRMSMSASVAAIDGGRKPPHNTTMGGHAPLSPSHQRRLAVGVVAGMDALTNRDWDPENGDVSAARSPSRQPKEIDRGAGVRGSTNGEAVSTEGQPPLLSPNARYAKHQALSTGDSGAIAVMADDSDEDEFMTKRDARLAVSGRYCDPDLAPEDDGDARGFDSGPYEDDDNESDSDELSPSRLEAEVCHQLVRLADDLCLQAQVELIAGLESQCAKLLAVHEASHAGKPQRVSFDGSDDLLDDAKQPVQAPHDPGRDDDQPEGVAVLDAASFTEIPLTMRQEADGWLRRTDVALDMFLRASLPIAVECASVDADDIVL